MDYLIEKIKKSQNIVISTHMHCDGDGLGSEIAMLHCLKKMGKKASIINIDPTPKKYHFLKPNRHIQYYLENPEIPEDVDLVLIFDTNDERLVEPLLSALKTKTQNIAFVDHHPPLKSLPAISALSLIDTCAASTGELTYRIIKNLEVPFDAMMAQAIYTSITFDTQLYRFVRNSPQSHLIAAEMLTHEVDVEEVHRALFGNQSIQKLSFLAKALSQIEYFDGGKLAIVKLKDADMFHYNVEIDDSREVIDMIMNIDSIEAAALFREDGPHEFKLSLRSKGEIEVMKIAESLGGGGHPYAAGAYLVGDYDQLKKQVIHQLLNQLEYVRKTGT